MAILAQPNLDFTDKDFDSMKARIVSMITAAFAGWTDFNVAGFNNVMIEFASFIFDNLGYYQDNQAAEAFMVGATQRKNLIALAKQIGYIPSGATAATVVETFTLGAVPANDVVIPVGTVVKTAEITEAKEFRLLAPLTIAASTDPPVGIGTCENAEPQQQVFTSTGLANQEYQLTALPYVDRSAVITAGNGIYTRVDDFLESRSNDRHFIVVIDQNDQATFRFGNGVNGEIPTGTVTVDYKTGGGSEGNVDEDTITRVEGSFTDVLLNPVSVTVSNAVKASGGTDRQTNASIKIEAPASLRVLNRTVAREDYEINALRVSGVARALMLSSDQDSTLDENTGRLFVIPEGGGTPTQVLKDAVLAMVQTTYPHTITFQLTVADPVYLTVSVFAVVFLREGYGAAAARSDIEDALEEFFAITDEDGTPNTNVDFGFNLKDAEGNPAGEIAFSDIYNAVRDVAAVRKIGDSLTEFTLNGEHQDVPIALREFPVLGSVTLIDGSTGQALPTS